MAPFNPHFSPFAAIPLPATLAPCYHWPMSERTSNSSRPPHPNLGGHLGRVTGNPDAGRATSPSQFSKAIPQGWPEILRQEGPKWNRPTDPRLPICAAVERKPPSHSPLVTRHCLKILENPITLDSSATSIFLIDNFSRRAADRFSSHSPLATRHCLSSEILIADLWKIRNRRNLLKTNERSRF